MNFVKFLRTPFLKEHLWWLLLMRAIVSAIGTLPYGISQYLVELFQPTLNESKYKITNSSSFVNEEKNWLVKRDEAQVS